MIWKILAEAVMGLHIALMLFALLFAVLLILGFFRGKRWARYLCYAMIAVAIYVGAVSYTGMSCPLTDAEYALRQLYDPSESWIRSRSLLGTIVVNTTGIVMPEFAFTIVLIAGVGTIVAALVTRRV